MVSYSMSKTFVHSLALNLAKDSNFQNKKVLCLLPPTLDTKANREAMPNEDKTNWVHPDSIAEIMFMMTQS